MGSLGVQEMLQALAKVAGGLQAGREGTRMRHLPAHPSEPRATLPSHPVLWRVVQVLSATMLQDVHAHVQLMVTNNPEQAPAAPCTATVEG